MNFKKHSGISMQVITPEDYAKVPKDLQGGFEETEDAPTHYVCNVCPEDKEKKLTASFAVRPLPAPKL